MRGKRRSALEEATDGDLVDVTSDLVGAEAWQGWKEGAAGAIGGWIGGGFRTLLGSRVANTIIGRAVEAAGATLGGFAAYEGLSALDGTGGDSPGFDWNMLGVECRPCERPAGPSRAR